MSINIKKALILFVLIDILCVGIGMGVPIFCILLGFPTGWYMTKRLINEEGNLKNVFKKIFKYSVVTSIFTFVGMAIIWGRMIPMIFKPGTDFLNTGVPLILYEPKISFIGWLVLMIFISPFLQLLTTVFTAYLTLLNWSEKGKR